MTQTYRVMILEDDADSAEELQLKLEQLGYAVVGVVSTGNAAGSMGLHSLLSQIKTKKETRLTPDLLKCSYH